MIKVAIIGATGYTGGELVRNLLTHDQVELTYLTSRSHIGEKVSDYYPFAMSFIGPDQEFVELTDQVIESVDLIFICLPHGHSMSLAAQAISLGTKVIDLGADFRLKDIPTFEDYYQVDQTQADLLEKAVYGLSEKNRDQIAQADLVANPGCYVTSALLALSPIVKAGLVQMDSIIIDAKSGVSGAGKSLNEDRMFGEMTGNFYAYSVTGHRHTPEIEQELSNLGQGQAKVQFTPHLLPIERGILATAYVDLTQDMSEAELRELYRTFYEEDHFIHVLKEGQMPKLKDVRGSNHAHIQVVKDERTGRLIILSAIDNLAKGASGQAVQNMNLMLGLPETAGLKQVPLSP